ncbi:MAG: hypothetical protein D5R96_08820, partial [Methanocalculus sp. MSAO_Arc2]
MRTLWLIPLLIILLALAGPAQAIVTLSVKVEDTFGNPLPGADVYVDGSHVGRTDGSGIFKHSHGGIDGFNLKISKSGYQSRTVFVEETERSRTVILSSSLSGKITIEASGDRTYYIGEDVIFSGTNTDSDTTYFFINGPNLPREGGQLLTPMVAVNEAAPGTFRPTPVRTDDTYERKWSTSGIGLDAGSY